MTYQWRGYTAKRRNKTRWRTTRKRCITLQAVILPVITTLETRGKEAEKAITTIEIGGEEAVAMRGIRDAKIGASLRILRRMTDRVQDANLEEAVGRNVVFTSGTFRTL